MGYGEMIGVSQPIRAVYKSIRRWAPLDVTVLVTGESGTGKELVARAIHAASRRRQTPFFAVNCSAMAESLLEIELFGHEKGAFTGAEETRPGLFEQVFGGTLVLDEVADMSSKMQAQLLRVLEEKKVRRIGSTEWVHVDVRLIALTNRPLDKEVEGGRFRMDLYHRLKQAEIELPPLRKRKEDILLLAEHFLSHFREGKAPAKISRGVAAILMRHRWPGNVRELRNQIQRASILREDRPLRPEDFEELGKRTATKTEIGPGPLADLIQAAKQEGFVVKRRHEDLFRVLLDGKRIRREEYERMAGVSKPTAARDLKRLTSMDLIRKEGKGLATMYEIHPSFRPA
jgi:DNA-binding NtrC family response regulator